MIKKEDKKGQFYLIATIAIIALIASFFMMSNSSTRKEFTKVHNLRDELQTESGKILDLGAVTGDYHWGSFTKNFSYYAGNDVSITYITGSNLTLEVFNYTDGTQTNVFHTTTPISSINTLVTIQLNNIDYDFILRRGENFYFIIVQDINGERYVETNSE